MHERRRPRRTSTLIKRTDIVFGAGFLSLGLVAVVASGMRVWSAQDPMAGASLGAYLTEPMVVGLAFSVIGAVSLMIGLREVWREARLLQVGTTTEAAVLFVERTNSRVNRKWLWQVRYTYEDHVGGTHEGASGHLSEAEALTFKDGETVFVRYDPDQPSSSMWLGREELPS